MPYTQSLQEQQLIVNFWVSVVNKKKKKQIPGSGKSKKRYLGTGMHFICNSLLVGDLPF